MEGATFLKWNLVNWITVFLMATIGAAVVATATAAYQTKFGRG